MPPFGFLDSDIGLDIGLRTDGAAPDGCSLLTTRRIPVGSRAVFMGEP